MVLHLAVIVKPSRREGKEEAKTMSSGRELELHKPLNLLPWSKALELSSAKIVNLALTLAMWSIFQADNPPNNVKTSTCSYLYGRYTYVGKDTKYTRGSIKSYKQNIMEY
jgi:hypothetical protein